MITKLLLIFSFTIKCFSKKYVLLPYNSELCQNESQGIHKFQELTLTNQINLNSNSNLSDALMVLKFSKNNNTRLSPYLSWLRWDNENYQRFFCRTLLRPMGRSNKVHDIAGYYNFWNLRIRIDRVKGAVSCNDYLLLQFRQVDNLIIDLKSHSDKTINITCQDALPIIITENLQKLYVTYFSWDIANPGYVINVTSFIHFHGDFSLQVQQELCRRHDGVWCNNDTSCIYNEMKCDGLDSCFDGGSDETDCLTETNATESNKRRYASSRVIDYMPWLALGILPIILLLALICICNQHRSEVYFDGDDDEADNLDEDKSADDDLWSSGDDLEKVNEVEEEGEDDGGCMPGSCGRSDDLGLVPLGRQETTRADITPSRTTHSISRDYEDIDQATALPGPLNNIATSKAITDNLLTGHDSGSNIMFTSQMTDDDYEDRLEDVGSLLRKVDKSKIPEEVRLTSIRSSNDAIQPDADNGVDYRSDYILV